MQFQIDSNKLYQLKYFYSYFEIKYQTSISFLHGTELLLENNHCNNVNLMLKNLLPKTLFRIHK